MKKSHLFSDIRQMADGNTDALAQFYQATAPAAYALALSMLKNHDAATHAMQESYLTAYETTAAFPSKENPMVWLLSIIYHQCSALKDIAPVEEIPPHFSPIVALSCVANASTKEIAKITGLPRKEIPAAKPLCKETDLVAFCRGIPEMLPDVSQSIVISALLAGKRPPLELLTNTPDENPRPAFRWKWLAIALPILAVLVLVGVGIHIATRPPVATILYLDGATSIRIELDENDQVLNVQGYDKSSKSLLKGLRLRSGPIDTALEKLISAMVDQGYLKNEPNELLLSISQPAFEDRETNRNSLKYRNKLSNLLKQHQVPAIFIYQVLPTADRVSQISQAYHVPLGKAGLIHRFLPESTPHTDPKVAELAEKSFLFFRWLRKFEVPIYNHHIGFLDTERMSQYFSPDEIVSRAQYLLTRANLRKPGSAVSLSHVAAVTDEIQTVYHVSLNISGEEYLLKVCARTGNFLSCARNGEPISINLYSDYSGLQAFTEEERAIQLALQAAECDADSVVFCTVRQDLNVLLSSSHPAPDFVPRKYQVRFYSADMYTHYRVDVLTTTSSILNIEKTEVPKYRKSISPREAVSLATAYAGKSEDDITSVFYLSMSWAKRPYYIVRIDFHSTKLLYNVNMETGAISEVQYLNLTDDHAILIAAEYYNLTPETLQSKPQLSVTLSNDLYRVTYTDGAKEYLAVVNRATKAIWYANTRSILTMNDACMLVAAKAGILLDDMVVGPNGMNGSDFIIWLYHGEKQYVSRVCAKTGVILYFDIRSGDEPLSIPQLQPSTIHTEAEALQLALEDALVSTNNIYEITIQKEDDRYTISFLVPTLGEQTYLISTDKNAPDPIISRTFSGLYG